MSEKPHCTGSWSSCPNAVGAYHMGYPVMRCRITGKHPNDCVAGKAYLAPSPDQQERAG